MNGNQGTTIAIIGSSTLGLTEEIQRKIISALTFLPNYSVVRTRTQRTSEVEGWINDVCDSQGSDPRFLALRYVAGPGRNNYKRDREMVIDIDYLMAFFDEEHFMKGGTGHVVQCAIEAEVPVEAWVSHADGSLSLVAEDDHGVQHGNEWLRTRNVAEMVQEFQKHALSVRLSGLSLAASPRTSKSTTPTGSASTAKTGKGRSRRGSIFQVPTA